MTTQNPTAGPREEVTRCPWVIRVYDSGHRDFPEETIACIGPFDGPAEAAQACAEAGWRKEGGDREHWTLPRRALCAELVELAPAIPDLGGQRREAV